MKKYVAYLIVFLTFFSCALQQDEGFTIANKNETTTIFIDENTNDLIVWAVQELAKDIADITGKSPILKKTSIIDGNGIYIGSIADKLLKNEHILTDSLKGNWEKFSITKQSKKLFITGSDVRGTVYGIFEVAERLGISPWKWWADVNPIKQSNLVLPISKEGITQSPSVQYRGIFLNDEDWGLQPWAAKTFEPEVGDIGPKTYEKIFQLLLRLKANTIWPAMHPSTKAFFTIEGNKEMAQLYQIFIGSSHAEPMLRNNVGEWNHDLYGDYNYFTNSAIINTYWQKRVNEVSDPKNKAIYSLGMRGIHDSHMEGTKSIEDNVAMLETIMKKQRNMLTNSINTPLSDIPQVLVPYKEVLDLYNHGLNVPNDVTLMWSDDNYGYIRRLSNTEEQKRAGGSGVYYHLSYWGRPHDYLWLSTTQPAHIWYEMTRAYQNGAQKIWIANVGDIKPGEYNMEFFLDLAWDINMVKPDSIKNHLNSWAAREFGNTIADEVGSIMSEYYKLAMLRKPEYMGFGQTEPTRPNTIGDFTTSQAKERIAAYKTIESKADSLQNYIPKERLNAWFQLVEYPVKGAANMNYKFLNWQLAAEAKDTVDEKKHLVMSDSAFKNIEKLTATYSNNNQGKWRHMMDMKPRRLPVFNNPSLDSLPKQDIKPTFSSFQIKGGDFIETQTGQGFTWKPINGLGSSNYAATIYPFKAAYFNKAQAWVSYELDAKKIGFHKAEIKLLPTHSNKFDHEIGVQLNQDVITYYPLNTTGRSEQWKENILRNATVIPHVFFVDTVGKQTMKLHVNQTGIVIDQIKIIAPD